jgi:uncharacterized protein with FMN-binding domain
VYSFAARALVVALFAVLVAGCGASKDSMEKAVSEEMKKNLNTDITAISLTKQADGTYAGTATAANGNTYDVTTTAPKGGKFEWTAVLAKESVEKLIREHMKTSLNADVTVTDMTKQADGSYTGTAAAANGDTYEVTAGAPTAAGIQMNYVAAQNTVERLVREDIEKQTRAKIKSFALTRKGPGVYTGTATQENGGVLSINTKLEGSSLTWTYRPLRP